MKISAGLSDFFKKNQLKRVNLLLLLAVAGIVLIGLAGILTGEQEVSQEETIVQKKESISEGQNYFSMIEAEEKALASHLEEVLSQVIGVGQVVVTVNLASSSQQEYAINSSVNNRTTEEKDQGGGSRIITETNESGQLVLIKGDQGGKEQPVIVKEYKPEVKGILVVAEGAKNIETKIEVIKAVQVLLNIPTHKITVLPKESR